jgi:hypothetical protein
VTVRYVVRKAGWYVSGSRFKVSPQPGASPAWDTAPVPDLSVWQQPVDDARRKREREHQETRRRAESQRNSGRYGIHGQVEARPEVRYDPEHVLSHPAMSPRPGLKKPQVRAPKIVARLEAGSGDRVLRGGVVAAKKRKRKKRKKRKAADWGLAEKALCVVPLEKFMGRCEVE